MSTVDPTTGLRPIDVTLSTRAYFEALWQRRDFAIAMPAENLRSQHQTTLLGNVWHLANPMLTIGVYALVFGVILGVDRGVDNYLLWLTVGVFAYQLSSSSILAGATSISRSLGLMRAVRFPRALIPISAVVGNLLTFGFQLLVVCGVAIVTGEGLSRRLLALPLVLAVQTMLNLGGAFVAARLNDSYRDVEQLIPFVFRLGQYASGVMFPIARFADTQNVWAQRLIAWNPFARLLDMYRWVFLGTPMGAQRVLTTVLMAMLVLVLGFRFFVAAEHRYGRR